MNIANKDTVIVNKLIFQILLCVSYIAIMGIGIILSDNHNNKDRIKAKSEIISEQNKLINSQDELIKMLKDKSKSQERLQYDLLIVIDSLNKRK